MASSSAVMATIIADGYRKLHDVELKSPGRTPESPQTPTLLPDDVQQALERRINKSIEKIEEQRKILEVNFNKKFPYENKIRYQLKENCIEAKKSLLEAGLQQLKVKGTFEKINEKYQKELETIKNKLKEEEKDWIAMRIQGSAEQKSTELKDEKEIEMLNEKITNEVISPFQKFTLKNVNFKELAKLKKELDNQEGNVLTAKSKFTDQKEQEETKLSEQDRDLQDKIKVLSTLKALMRTDNLRGNHELQTYLLNDPDRVDEDGFTSLFYACIVSDLELTELLIKKNIKKNIKTDRGYPLHYVLSHEPVCAIQFLQLLEPTLDILIDESPTNKKRNAFDLSAYHNNLPTLQWMIAMSRKNPDFDFVSIAKRALKCAASKGHVAIVEDLLPELLVAKQNILSDLHAALASAFQKGRTEVATVFYKAGILLPERDLMAILSTNSSITVKQNVLKCLDAIDEVNKQTKQLLSQLREEKDADRALTGYVGRHFKTQVSDPLKPVENPKRAPFASL